MAITHTLTYQWASGAGSITHAIAVSSGAENNLDEAIPENSTDLVVAFALDVSQLKALYMVADAAMTVKTNTGADQTFTLVANTPMAWNSGSPIVNPITVDITTGLKVTNTTAGTLRIRALIDPTL